MNHTSWRPFIGSENEWDALITQLDIRTPFQLSAWARFRATFGWQTLRLTTSDNSTAVQFLTRSAGPLRVAWAAGGPVGDSSQVALHELPAAVKSHLGGKALYLRVADHQPRDEARERLFSQAGWTRPRRELVNNHTLIRHLDGNDSTLSSAYSTNWSRNLRRGLQRNVVADVWTTPDSETMARLHRDVESTKGSFSADWRAHADSLNDLIACFGARLVVVRAVGESDGVLSIRAAVMNGAYAFDFLAATSSDGRKCYASNVAMHALLGAVAARGARSYDFGGVDPKTNKGVYNFKHGAGGVEHRYVGEFEFVSPGAIKPTVSKLVALRLSAQHTSLD